MLTAQTTTSENGIYEVSSVTSTYDSNQGGSGEAASDYYVSLARASGFDSSEEFITGSFVFVEKGSQVGQGYVLGELASDFALGIPGQLPAVYRRYDKGRDLRPVG